MRTLPGYYYKAYNAICSSSSRRLCSPESWGAINWMMITIYGKDVRENIPGHMLKRMKEAIENAEDD